MSQGGGGIRSLLASVREAFGPRQRRAWMGPTRAHIEARDMSSEELGRFERALGDIASRNAHVKWIELNPHTRRVVIEIERGSVELASLIELVESAEQSARVERAGFSETAAEHPADEEPFARLKIGAALDLVGVAVGGALRVSPVSPSNIASSAVAIAAVVRAAPRLRQGLDQALGPRRADLALGSVISLAQGVAQRPVASLVDLAHKAALLREARGRKDVWEAREPELSSAPYSHDPGRARLDPRPVPLPRGPIEEYADRAWIVSVGGFAVSFLTTRSLQHAVAALFGALPKPARLGRDVFAAELGRALAARRVLVLDPDVLRRLDRIDCLVIQGDLVTRDRFELGNVVVADGSSERDVRRRVLELFEPEHPVSVVRRGEWTLGPPGLLDAPLGRELEERTAELALRGAIVLGLARAGKIVAIAELGMIPQTGIEELIAAAHEAQMRVVIASNDEAVLQGLNVDDAIPFGDGLPSGIRRLQREGRGVMLVATGRAVGIGSADCALGLSRAGEPPPWGAHLVAGEDLSDVRFVVQACATAQKVAKQSVNVALGAAAVGALISAGGTVTARRVFTIVNGASLIAMANGVRNSASLARKALPPPRDRTPWHALEARGVLSKLGSSEQGLTRAQAESRKRPHDEEKPALLELTEAITDELFNPLAPLLAAGAGLSAVVGSVADAGMVGGVVALNAMLGGVQRFRTERAIRRLASDTRRRAVVRRGEQREVDAAELVRGDVVLLSPGDVVPADCRIVSEEALEVDASSLTGESLPVKKRAAASFDADVADRASMLYEGTSIAAGHASAVVVATGDETEARRGSTTTRRDVATSGVEQRLRALINLTGPLALGAGAALITTGALRGRRLKEVVSSGVSLAVASVPEGLPLLATAAQLAAAERLSRRGALVRNARNIEALGRVDVLCVDKTGTVTEGRVELRSVSDGVTSDPATNLVPERARVLAAALRATPVPDGAPAAFDPLDAALLRAAERSGVAAADGADGWKRTSELPFEAGRGYHAVVGQTASEQWLDVKGAPEVILPQCTRWARDDARLSLDAVGMKTLATQAAELARQGLRVLAVAERVVSADDRIDPARLVGLSFVGFIAFSDPVRPSARAALDQLRTAGVETIMITGDHPSTAEAVARELDLLRGKRVLSGAELSELSEDQLDGVIRNVSVFARLTPPQKVRVVRALQRAGHCVAMVGDGSNDAPAIRLANVGIAMGERSTSAARGAADVVITDERIETLVDAIVEGRAMWASVRDAVSILVGGNLGEVGFSVAAGLVDGHSPLNARQLLLVNLLTDVAPAMAIALRPPAEETLKSLANEGPDASLGDALSRDIASRALVTAAGAGAAYFVGRLTSNRERAATTGLVALVGTQLGQTLASGGASTPVVLTSLASAAVLAGIVQTPFVSHFFGCRPMGPLGWTTAIGASALATGASMAYPEVVEKVARRLRLVQVMPDTSRKLPA